MKNNTKKLTALALSVSIAMILSFVESRIPAFVAIPGIKIGLANIAVIFVLYKLGFKEATAVSCVKVALSSLLFGNPISMIYSLVGAALSLTAMALLKQLTPLAVPTVSIIGAISHNIGQILAAMLILGTGAVIYYLPFLLVSGILSGIAVGAASTLLIKKTPSLGI